MIRDVTVEGRWGGASPPHAARECFSDRARWRCRAQTSDHNNRASIVCDFRTARSSVV